MSKLDKQIERIKSKPKDYTFDEAKKLLKKLGFEEDNKGRTSGSRVAFINNEMIKIELHRPHPGKILKQYQIKIILDLIERIDYKYE